MFLVISPEKTTIAYDLIGALDTVTEAQDNSTHSIYLVNVEEDITYAYHYYDHLGEYDAAIIISHSVY